MLEPLFFGKSTGLSPVAVVVAAAFWTALWGPVGLVLSTPMTIVLLVVGRHIEALQFLEVLLGSKPVLTPDHAFYQRMLANDPVEAAENAEIYVEEESLDKYIDEVAIPGLLLAQNDKTRGVLTEDREVTVVTAYSELLEDLWPEGDAAADAASPVIVIAAHGALNFAAALSMSAFLRAKNVPHRLMPPDAVQPGKFPDELAEGAAFVCLCWLTAPSEARYRLYREAHRSAAAEGAHSGHRLARRRRRAHHAGARACAVAAAFAGAQIRHRSTAIERPICRLQHTDSQGLYRSALRNLPAAARCLCSGA